MPIDFGAPRILTFTDRGRVYAFSLSPISKAQWMQYFAGIVSTQELDAAGNQTSSYDSTAARLELLQSVLQSATGYGVDVDTVDGWQGKLPMSHRRALADLLVATDVDLPLADDAPIQLGFETVRLRSTWSYAKDGVMQETVNLQHVFTSPSADHQRRYSRAYNTSVVTGRTGQTRYLGAQGTLIEIYDELIESVSGYTVNGTPLPANDIVGTMDAYHKVVACTALFTPVQMG